MIIHLDLTSQQWITFLVACHHIGMTVIITFIKQNLTNSCQVSEIFRRKTEEKCITISSKSYKHAHWTKNISTKFTWMVVQIILLVAIIIIIIIIIIYFAYRLIFTTYTAIAMPLRFIFYLILICWKPHETDWSVPLKG